MKEYCMGKLKEIAQLEGYQQRKYEDEINRRFREFWSYGPTREEFNETMNGLLLTPDILYTMAKGVKK